MDQVRGLDFTDSPDGGFDFADDASEDAADDTAEDAADDAAFDAAFDAALDSDVGNLLFGDFVRDFDGGDELAGFETGLGLDGLDPLDLGGGGFLGRRRRRRRRRGRRGQEGAGNLDLGKIRGGEEWDDNENGH
jgi:hypothetical protein